MPIAVSDEQRALADALRAWAARARPVQLARAMETAPDTWRSGWAELAGLGALAVALPEAEAGGGGSVTDQAVALEQLAAALVPGPVLPTVLAARLLAGHADRTALGTGALTAGVALEPADLHVGGAAGAPTLSGTVRPVLGATPEGLLVVGDAAGTWYVVDPDDGRGAAKVVDLPAADFSVPLAEVRLDAAPARRIPVSTDDVRDAAAQLAAAEAAGVAAWCLRTAVDYAKVREQFGRPIGSFQAVKHLCAEMLGRAEVAAALAWDAAEAADVPDQRSVAAAAAAAIALDAAVENAKDCIQVLGGIGFTWEHDAHLYLRRAIALRGLLGATDAWRQRVAALTIAGRRRALRVHLDQAAPERDEVRRRATAIAALPDEQRRSALVDAGYLTPHWPHPHGLDADPHLQLLIDEELDRAGVVRPDLVIAGWVLPTMLRHGTPAQVERFVGPTLRGELVWCQLFSEPGAGSDLAALRTSAKRVDGGWRLSGQKVWTSVAQRADYGVCLARTDPEAPRHGKKHDGISYFVVDMKSAGIDIRPLREITGEALFNEVFLDGVFVPDEQVVGDVGGGWALARTTLSQERVAMGRGSSIGEALESLIEATHRCGRADDPVVATRLGALIAEGLAGSLLDQRTTLRRLGGQDDGAAASVRKLVGVRHRQAVAEAAYDLQGSEALLAGEELREFLSSRCLSIAGGTTQVLLTLAAERLLGLPRG